MSEYKIENERVAKSAVISKNPFVQSSMSGELNFFDFNPATISQLSRSVLEEPKEDDGYQGDNEEKGENESMKRLEKRVKKVEAVAAKSSRSSENSSPSKFSSKILHETSTFVDDVQQKLEAEFLVKQDFDKSLFNEENMTKLYQKHPRNRSFSENRDSEIRSTITSSENVDPIHGFPQSTAKPFKNGKRLLKTPSETYLETFSIFKAYQTSDISNIEPSQLKPTSNQNQSKT